MDAHNDDDSLPLARERVAALEMRLKKINGGVLPPLDFVPSLKTLTLARAYIVQLGHSIRAIEQPAGKAAPNDQIGLIAERDRALRERAQATVDRNDALDKLRATERERDAAQRETAAASTAITERDQALADLATLQGRFDAIPGPTEALSAAEERITLLTRERDTALKNYENEKMNCQRLETFAGVRGLSLDELPRISDSLSNGLSKGVYAKWKSLDGAARTTFWRENRAAIRADAIASGKSLFE